MRCDWIGYETYYGNRTVAIRCNLPAEQFVLTWANTPVCRCLQHSVETKGRLDLREVSRETCEIATVHTS